MTASPVPAQKEDRLHIRVSDRQKKVIAEAARSRHVTTSQFVIQATLTAAYDVLADKTEITFTPEQWEAFQQRLDEPARVIPALQKLHTEMNRSGE